MIFSYFVQPFMYPFASLENLHTKFLKDLEITDSDKQYLTNFLILNVFFDSYNDLWKNLGMSYFTIRDYFKSNSDFIIVKDETRNLYLKAKTFIDNVFRSFILKIPVINPLPDKRLVVSSYDDLFDKNKVLNTAIYLSLKYAKPNSDSISFDIIIPTSVGFIGD